MPWDLLPTWSHSPVVSSKTEQRDTPPGSQDIADYMRPLFFLGASGWYEA